MNLSAVPSRRVDMQDVFVESEADFRWIADSIYLFSAVTVTEAKNDLVHSYPVSGLRPQLTTNDCGLYQDRRCWWLIFLFNFKHTLLVKLANH